jgi:hypothetical protein
MAQSRAANLPPSCPLSGVKRTSQFDRAAAANDPNRRIATINYRTAKGSLDHPVGDGEYVLRSFDAERFRRLKVDDELEFGRLHDRPTHRGRLPPCPIA